MSTSPAPYTHWMLREIFEQPETLAATLDLYVADNAFRQLACEPIRRWLNDAGQQIVIAASGSSRHAGLVAEQSIEDLSGLAVDVEYASEYVYRADKTHSRAAVMVISQSGETADTLAALRKANLAGRPTLAITNVPDSAMAREASVSFPTAAGHERAIPATKSFTAQLLNLYLLSLLAAEMQQQLTAPELQAKLAELAALPSRVQSQLAGWQAAVRDVGATYRNTQSFLLLGRGVHYAIAREGALKLKESAYLHAEGYPSGELKHGPNALVTQGTPLVMIATFDSKDSASVQRYEKVLQLMRDMHAQGADILAIANTADQNVTALANNTIFVEESSEALLPLYEVIPLQLLSYFMAIHNGIDVDTPRNLTKAVLAE